MADYIVTNTDNGANLRSAPDLSSSYRNLPFGTTLRLVTDSPTKWKFVETTAGDRGYVSTANLTVPASDAVTRLISSVAYYWEKFSFGAGSEDVGPYYDIVVQMWKDLGMGMPPKKKDKNGNTVKDKNGNDIYNTSHPDWPWSAAGMSAFIRRATGYTGFQYQKKHSYYIHDSIVARTNDDAAAPYWGYKIDEDAVRVGDLVVQWRVSAQDYASAAKNNNFSSHTDVVCDIRGSYLYAIGANVDKDTVGRKRYAIFADGKLKGPAGTTGRDKAVFMFMRNRAT